MDPLSLTLARKTRDEGRERGKLRTRLRNCSQVCYEFFLERRQYLGLDLTFLIYVMCSFIALIQSVFGTYTSDGTLLATIQEERTWILYLKLFSTGIYVATLPQLIIDHYRSFYDTRLYQILGGQNLVWERSVLIICRLISASVIVWIELRGAYVFPHAEALFVSMTTMNGATVIYISFLLFMRSRSTFWTPRKATIAHAALGTMYNLALVGNRVMTMSCIGFGVLFLLYFTVIYLQGISMIEILYGKDESTWVEFLPLITLITYWIFTIALICGYLAFDDVGSIYYNSSPGFLIYMLTINELIFLVLMYIILTLPPIILAVSISKLQTLNLHMVQVLTDDMSAPLKRLESQLSSIKNEIEFCRRTEIITEDTHKSISRVVNCASDSAADFRCILHDLLQAEKILTFKESDTCDKSPMNMAEFIRHTGSKFVKKAESLGINFRYETTLAYPSNSNVIACIDGPKIEQALRALLQNAFKFTSTGDEVVVRMSTIYRRPESSVIVMNGRSFPKTLSFSNKITPTDVKDSENRNSVWAVAIEDKQEGNRNNNNNSNDNDNDNDNEEGEETDFFETQAPNFVRIDVIDTGIGMSLGYVNNLFLSHTALKRGLGLRIAKKIIEIHKGFIGATSKGLDCGAMFSFEIPLATVDDFKNFQNKFIGANSRYINTLNGNRRGLDIERGIKKVSFEDTKSTKMKKMHASASDSHEISETSQAEEINFLVAMTTENCIESQTNDSNEDVEQNVTSYLTSPNI